MKIKKLMHSSVKICALYDTLESAANQMWNEDVGALAVIDNQNMPCGVLTDRDIAMAAALQHRPLWEISVFDVKHGHPLYTCRADDEVHSALQTMGEKRIRRMLVVDDEGSLVGIVSLKDLIDHTSTKGKAEVNAVSADDALGVMREICRPNALQAAH